MIDITISTIVGYHLMKLISHPKSKIRKKLPLIKIKFIQLSPNLTFAVKGKVIWFHHWICFSVILIISIIVDKGFLSLPLIKGALLGGIIQGFTYPDWKRIIQNKK